MNQPMLVDTAAIPGWGVDADPENDPTYPYRDRSRDDGPGMTWERPPQQQPDVEILRSIEHNRLPAVFGTSTPPRALSGVVRRLAFRWSESNWMHWLLLMGADRIDVVEGLVEDLGRGKIPNIPAEMGARAEWKHNKKGFVTKAAVTGAVLAGTIAFFATRGKRRPETGDADGNGRRSH